MRILDLVSQRYSADTAKKFASFIPTDQELQILLAVGRDVLDNFPVIPGACVPMTCLYAARWRMISQQQAFVVSGQLSVAGNIVFGAELADSQNGFDLIDSNLSWDGHCWLVFGPYVADVSVFRTAFSDFSPPLLAEHVRERCGKGTGMFIANESAAKQMGFEYIPRAVLSEDQITSQILGAQKYFLGNMS